MKNSQKDILNRVLLLMKYDNNKTLTENRLIINEQQKTLPNFNDTIGQAEWLNKNYGNKDFNSVWKDYLTNISNLDLQKLLDIQKKIADKGYGSITPGLYGFNRPSVGISNIPLENQIYVLKKRKYDREKESKKFYNPQTRQYQYYGEEPNPPQYNLLSGIVEIQSGQLGVKNKTAQQILSDLNKSKVTKQSTQINKTDKSQIGSSDPKKISREELGFVGDKLDAQRDTKGITQKAANQEKAFTIAQKNKELEAEESKKYNQWEEEQLKKYDFSKFPNPIDRYMGKPIYDKEYWIEPNTKKRILIQGKTIDEVKRDLLNQIQNIEQLKSEDQILNNPLLIKIFGEVKLNNSIKNCKRENLIGFFTSVLDGDVKDKKGNVYGKYGIDSSGNSFFVKWPKDKPIPCTDEFWDKYGLYIQLGGMLAIGILSGGLGLGPSAALFVELAADTALNLYSLKKSTESQDEDAIKLDLAYIFLPFLMASKPVRELLKTAKFGDDVINSVESKIGSLPRNSTTSQVDNLIKNMTPEEQRVIRELGNEEYTDVIQKVSKQTLDNLKKTAKAPLSRRLSNPLINILVYGAPISGYLIKKINEIDTISKNKRKKGLTNQEKELWAMAISFLDDEDKNKFIESLETLNGNDLNKLLSNPKIQQAIQKKYYTEQIKNEKDREESANKLIDNIRKIIEESVITVEKSNPDIDLIVLDEPIIK